MAKLNSGILYANATHGGGIADPHLKPKVELERAVATCLLWEDAHYESGKSIAARIVDLCANVPEEFISQLAVKARNEYKLRHVPLLLCCELSKYARGRKDGLVRNTLVACIQRADELAEFLAIYWRDGKHPLSAQVKKGLAEAFQKFSAYQLQKWNLDAKIKLRDVAFLTHPISTEVISRLVNKSFYPDRIKRIHGAFEPLPVADTWEVALSAGKDKKATWERLLEEGKLGYTALLKNLRNMQTAGVEDGIIRNAIISGAPKSKELPFRFITAARYAPRFEDVLGQAMIASITEKKLHGKTILIVDVSGSMDSPVSGKSELNRVDAAAALAALLRETCEEVVIYATAGSDISRVHNTALIAPRREFALINAIRSAAHNLGGGGIFLAQCMQYIESQERRQASPDRVIVITDEQDCDNKLSPATSKLLGNYNYILNMAQYGKSISFDRWTTISGWSEHVVDWVAANERMPLN